tara:strand:+ start:3807 stop:5126 length:1320 start_codon:yes stop_codon:yes gene_type:complete
MMISNTGFKIFQFCKKIKKFNRSITGEGNRLTLKEIKKEINNLKILNFKSGFRAFDWVVPEEWNVIDAYIKDPNGKKIVDIKNNYLHLVGYSKPVKKLKINLKNLKNKIYSLSKYPNSIPYITTYYKKDWGFCMTHSQKKKLKKGNYIVNINSNFKKGKMDYGEIFIPGKTKKEIFISTYICHTQMANNELSGIGVTTFLLKYLKNLPKQNYSIRAVFIPETIGSISYIKKNLNNLKKNVIAGFNITCVGDDRTYSYLPSRNENTISDICAKHVLNWVYPKYKNYTWNERGSDERQYCSPGVDLPVVTISRSKFGEFPEYHTSKDDFGNVVTPKGLLGSYSILLKIIQAVQNNCYPISLKKCEPFMSKYKLYNPHKDTKYSQFHKFNSSNTDPLFNLLSQADGKKSLIEIADKLLVPVWELYKILEVLKKKKLIKILMK